jgi:hypothetical protein
MSCFLSEKKTGPGAERHRLLSNVSHYTLPVLNLGFTEEELWQQTIRTSLDRIQIPGTTA